MQQQNVVETFPAWTATKSVYARSAQLMAIIPCRLIHRLPIPANTVSTWIRKLIVFAR